MNGAAFGSDVIDFNADDDSATNTGQAVIAVDPAAFGDPAAFRRQVDVVRREMTGSALRPGFDEIRLPGDRALRVRQERLAEGVPVPEGCGAAECAGGGAGIRAGNASVKRRIAGVMLWGVAGGGPTVTRRYCGGIV